MKKLFWLFFVLAPVFSMAQDDDYHFLSLPSVAGVTLGDKHDDVVSKLDDRFGKYNKSSDAGTETYYEVEVGGVFYKFAEFQFIHKSGKKVLNRVRLYSNYSLNEVKDAKSTRDYIARVYRKKYSDMEERTDADGFKYFVCNLNPMKHYYWIVIGISKSKSNSGKLFYYMSTEYGPLYTESTDDI